MQDPELYVRNFQEEISQRNKRKQPVQYPDDQRLHERPRVRKIEPPSQIISQSLLKNHSYVADPLKNFTKPLISYQITSPSGRDPQRYNHNFLYLGQDNIFYKEPYNQFQKDYAPQRYSHQSNEQRINYQNVGNMLIGGDSQTQIQNQTQQQNQSMTQSQLKNQQAGYGYQQQQSIYNQQQYQQQQQQQQQQLQSQQQQQQQQLQSQQQQQQQLQSQQQQQLYQQQVQQQQQQLSQSQLQKHQYQQQQQYQIQQVPTQSNYQNQQFSQQFNHQQAGISNTYKLKSENNHQPFNYYGSRALKNLDSTQIY
ncbi:unnamed protein product [Paramecium primaurelia]|uniref:Uncharacterized protein n=1 Tax=Paramecium primaurelia TaxID=5886 RepID=A0A8S1N9W0_PARPR|nr:unnamed protein product [Paramecium primaurelia]